MTTQKWQITRKTRKQKVAEHLKFLKAKKYKINWFSITFSSFFLLGLTLVIFEINIYRETVIDLRIPLGIWILSGLLITPLIRKFLSKYHATEWFFSTPIYNIVTWGGLTVYSFMAINYYFPKGKERNIKVEILDTGHLAKGSHGCGNPYAAVIIEGRKKQLIFPCDYEIERYKYIDLIIMKGFWGIDIIKNKTLLGDKKLPIN